MEKITFSSNNSMSKLQVPFDHHLLKPPSLQVGCRSNGVGGHEPSGHSGAAAANGFDSAAADGTDAAYDATNDANGNANDATDDGNCWNCWNCWNGSSKYFLYDSDATGAAVVHGGSGGGRDRREVQNFRGCVLVADMKVLVFHRESEWSFSPQKCCRIRISFFSRKNNKM